MVENIDKNLVNEYINSVRECTIKDVKLLIAEFISPKITREYNPYLTRFRAREIIELCKAGVPPDISNKFSWQFDSFEIKELFKRSINPEVANGYVGFIHQPLDILKLVDANCSVKDFLKYKFDAHNVAILFENNIDYKVANEYGGLFNSFGIIDLIRVNCYPNMAKSYDSNLDGTKIAILYAINISPEKLISFGNEKKDRFYEVLNDICKVSGLDRQIIGYHPKLKIPLKNYSFIGTGYHSLVLLNQGSAFKFSLNIQEEEELLKRLNNPNNIMQLKERVKIAKNDEKIAIELEYIQGDSLESILEKENKLPSEKVLKYGSDIMNGLIEMRQAGIFYHRDLRPANIMVEETEDKAVIIDLGIATTDRKTLPKDNRRYGGVNDLVSLGQVMYKMITGEHIFAESKSMEQTIQCHKIKDSRDLIYADNTGKLLQERIGLVDKNIQDESIKTLIKACLTAKNHEYKKMHRIFQSYLKA